MLFVKPDKIISVLKIITPFIRLQDLPMMSISNCRLTSLNIPQQRFEMQLVPYLTIFLPCGQLTCSQAC